jgi:hypothetical protein
MRGGTRRYAACDLPTINHDDPRTSEGEFIGRENPGNTRANNYNIAFLAALERCRVCGDRNVHPKRLAAPIDEMIHLKAQ